MQQSVLLLNMTSMYQQDVAKKESFEGRKSVSQNQWTTQTLYQN